MTNEVAILAFDQDAVIIAGSPTFVVSTSNRLNGGYNPANANNDEVFFNRFFAKGGLYKIRVIYNKNSNYAKMDIGLDANGATNIASQIDCYNASATYNNIYETVLEISRGIHAIHIKANGKNASSSNYALALPAIQFDLIQEYPVYQDAQPSNGITNIHTKSANRFTGLIAAKTLVSYLLDALDSSFLLSANVLVTTSTTHAFTMTVTYTDEGGTSRVLTLNFSLVAGTIGTSIANAAGAVPYEGVPMRIRCKGGTTVTIATTGTFTSVVYNAEASVIKC